MCGCGAAAGAAHAAPAPSATPAPSPTPAPAVTPAAAEPDPVPAVAPPPPAPVPKPPGPTVTAEATVGALADGNVSVGAIDLATSASDSARTWSGRVALSAPVAAKTTATASLDLAQVSYGRFASFDVGTRVLTGGLSHEFGPLAAGATARAIHVDLGARPFLTIRQASLFASRPLGPTALARLEVTHSDQDFRTVDGLDARVDEAALGVSYYLAAADLFVNGTVGLGINDARDRQYDYDKLEGTLTVSHGIALAADRKATLTARIYLAHNDYGGVTPAIGVRRRDRIGRLNLDAELPFADGPFGTRLFVRAGVERGDYRSNFPAADFVKSVARLSVGVRY